MKNLIVLILSAGVLAGCAHVTKSVVAIQPPNAVDTPKVWVNIITDDDTLNGVYRCSDEGGQPVCKKAILTTR